MNPINNGALGERVATLEGCIVSIERRLDEYSSVEEDVTAIKEYITQVKATDAERERQQVLRHQENKTRLDAANSRITRWGIIIAAFALLCSICMVYLAWKAASHAEMDPIKLFKSDIPPLTAAAER